MSFNKYMNEVRKLDVEALLDFLNEHGYGEFRQILRVKGIDGDTFLNLTEFDVMRWKPLGINTKKLWSCITHFRQDPQSFMNGENMQNQMESFQTYDNVMKPSNPLPLPPQKLPLPDKPKLPPMPTLFLSPSNQQSLPPSLKFQVSAPSPPPPPPLRSPQISTATPSRSPHISPATPSRSPKISPATPLRCPQISPATPSRSPQMLPAPPKVQVLPSPPKLKILPTPPRLQEATSPPPPATVGKKSNNVISSLKQQLEFNTYLQMENLTGNRLKKQENDYLIPIDNNGMTDHHENSYEPMEETSPNFPTSAPKFPTSAPNFLTSSPNFPPSAPNFPTLTPHFKNIRPKIKPETPMKVTPISLRPPQTLPRSSDASYIAPDDMSDEDFAPPSDEVYEPSPEVPPEPFVLEKSITSRKALPELPIEDEDTYEPTPGSLPLVTGKSREKPPLPQRNFQMMTKNTEPKRKISPRIYENTEVEMEQMLMDNKDDSFSKRIRNFFKSPISKRYKDETKQGNSEFYKTTSPDPDLEEYENITMPDSKNESIFNRPLPGLPVEKPKVGMDKMVRPNSTGMERMMEPNVGMESMKKPAAGMKQMMISHEGMERDGTMDKMMKRNSEMERGGTMDQMMKRNSEMEHIVMKPAMEQMMKPDAAMKQVMTLNEGTERMMKTNDGMKKMEKTKGLQSGTNKSETVQTPASPTSPVYGNHEIFLIPDTSNIANDTDDEEFDDECESPSFYENKETLTTQDTKADRGELIKKLSQALNLRNRHASQDLEKNKEAPFFHPATVNVQKMSESTTPEVEKPKAMMTMSMPELNTAKLNLPEKDELIKKLSMALNLDNRRVSQDCEETGQMNASRMDSPDEDPIYGNDPENTTTSNTIPERGGQMMNMPSFPSSYDHHFIDSKMKEPYKMLPPPTAEMTPSEFSEDELEEYDTIVYNYNSEPFFRNTDRKGAKLYLEGQGDGVYLIRPSRNNNDFDLTLNIKYQTKIFNMGIYKSKNKYHYQCDTGMSKEQFSTLHELIEHFKTHPLHFSYNNTVTDIYLTDTLPSDL